MTLRYRLRQLHLGVRLSPQFVHPISILEIMDRISLDRSTCYSPFLYRDGLTISIGFLQSETEPGAAG